ncbi:MAG: PspA/IM30 family protein [Cyclobacteriaceae bacterium]
MNVFRRLFKLGEAEAHSAIDKLEDPIKLTEQGIRDLKLDLDKSLKALAEVKALSIRAKNDVKTHQNKAADYESKAMLLLKKAQAGDISAEEADRLASEALVKKEEALQSVARAKEERDRFDKNVSQLDVNVKKIKSTISKYENELKTLKARVRVSETTKKLNKQIAQIDSSGTVSMLERMKEKVEQDEALAEAYGDIANENRSIDEELDAAIGKGGAETKASDDLAALKAKLGMKENGDA